MIKISRMAYDSGIIRESNTALLNHNKCVDKINEIIDVLNAQETRRECGECRCFVPVEWGEGICEKGHGIFKQPTGALPLAYQCFNATACAEFIEKREEKLKCNFDRNELVDIGAALLFRERVQDRELMAKINKLLVEEGQRHKAQRSIKKTEGNRN